MGRTCFTAPTPGSLAAVEAQRCDHATCRRGSTPPGTAVACPVAHALQAGLGLATMVITPSEAVREVMDRSAARARSGGPAGGGGELPPGPAVPRGRPYLSPARWSRARIGLCCGPEERGKSFSGSGAGRLPGDFREPPHRTRSGPAKWPRGVAALYWSRRRLYPSLYEGLVPVPEAMQCGAVVIAPASGRQR
jgi:hypothetical protein